jgi:ABC-type glycerol-3-phosphate transport system permease component
MLRQRVEILREASKRSIRYVGRLNRPRRLGQLGALERLLIYTLLTLGAIFILLPFWWMLATALKSTPEIIQWPPSLIPRQPQFSNFVKAWTYLPFSRFFLNSTIVAVIGTVAAVSINSLAGFAFAKYRFPGRDLLFVVVLATMMVPFQVTMIPTTIIVSRLHLINSYPGLILPGLAHAFGIFLLRQFYVGFPDEILDAARIDGASELRIYWRIVLPLSKPAIGALAILTFVWRWNDFLWPLIVVQSDKMYTLQLGLAHYVGRQETGVVWNYLMANSIIAIAPLLVVFLLFQRHLVRGITMTGLGG